MPIHFYQLIEKKTRCKIFQTKITLKTKISKFNTNEIIFCLPIMVKPINHNINVAYNYHF